MEQLEFDCRLESERELEENVNIALDPAAGQGNQQVEGIEPPANRYGMASEFYAGMNRLPIRGLPQLRLRDVRRPTGDPQAQELFRTDACGPYR